MTGIFRLWKNECIKLGRQVANRVIIIIALVLAILLPIAVSLLEYSDTDYWNSSDYYSEVADNISEYWNKVQYIALADACEFYEENDLPDWKRQEYFYRYSDAILMKLVCEGVISGEIEKTIAYDYYSYLFMEESEDEVYYESAVVYSNSDVVIADSYVEEYEYFDDVDEFVESTDFESYLSAAEETIENLEKEIPALTIKEYATEMKDIQNDRLKAAKLRLSDLNKQYESGDVTAAAVDSEKVAIESLEFGIGFYEELADAEEADEDWMARTISDFAGQMQGALVASCPVDEETYIEDYVSFRDETYEEYVEGCKKQQNISREALIMVQYSLENNIPIPQVLDRSTKSVIQFSLSGLSSILILAMVVLTATTIANEYSQGTIRLLTIRPRTRTKIIFSKFLALLSTGILLTVFGFVLVYVTSIIANGVNDAFVADLMYSSKVIEIDAVLFGIIKLFLSLFSGILLVALVFMLAVVTRKAMLSIVLPLIVSMASYVVQTVAVMGIAKHPIFKLTVFPYLDLSSYLVSPLSRFTGDSSLFGMLFGSSSGLYLSSGVSMIQGVTIVALHILVLFVVAFAVFRRQQIKN